MKLSFSNVLSGLESIKNRVSTCLVDINNVNSELEVCIKQLECNETISEELESTLELLDSYKEALARDMDSIEKKVEFLKDAKQFLVGMLDQESALVLSNVSKLEKDQILPNQSDLSQSKCIESKSLHKCFPKVPKDLIQSHTSKQELLYLSAAYELVTTESDYIQDLTTMINVSISCILY